MSLFVQGADEDRLYEIDARHTRDALCSGATVTDKRNKPLNGNLPARTVDRGMLALDLNPPKTGCSPRNSAAPRWRVTIGHAPLGGAAILADG